MRNGTPKNSIMVNKSFSIQGMSDPKDITVNINIPSEKKSSLRNGSNEEPYNTQRAHV